jgi:AraC-like DNA-binding protein
MISWSTANYPRIERYDVWDQQLRAAYCGYDLDKPFQLDFEAMSRSRDAEGLTVIDCVCDPFSATRPRSYVGRDSEEVFGIQLVLDGREEVCMDGQSILLTRGDLLLWDSARPIKFCVREKLHKFSVVTPLSRFRHWLPASWDRIPRKLENGSNAANLLSAHMQALFTYFLDDDTVNSDGLSEATLGLVVNAIGRTSQHSPGTLRAAQILGIKQYIDRNLAQPDLSPSTIAAANNISVRYLHWLFEPAGVTVSQYVIRQRLLRCRRELSSALMRNRTITEIAFSWGFQDATHFSRRFKLEFGLSARDFRRKACDVRPMERALS